MARITKELKALVERQLVAKIHDAVETADRERAELELVNENAEVEQRNAVRKQLVDMGLVKMLKDVDKVLEAKGDLFEKSRDRKYYGPKIELKGFSLDMEKPAKRNNKTYFSVRCTNSVGNVDIHHARVMVSGGVASNDKQYTDLQKHVQDIVDGYDKALVAVALGANLEEARAILADYGVSF